MAIDILIPNDVHEDLVKHLLPLSAADEEAAFIFCNVFETKGNVVFQYLSSVKAQDTDYDYKSAWHIELSDEFRSKLIKQAHDLNASVIELHSHIDQDIARFSPSDMTGFADFVPHMFWRLKGKPYAAIVVTEGSWDGFVWIQDPTIPLSINSIRTEYKTLYPTNASFIKYFNGK